MKNLALLIFTLIAFCFSFNTHSSQWAKDLRVAEPLMLKEFADSATPTNGYGAIYVKAADNDLYYMDALGNEFNVLLRTGPSIDLNYLSDVDTYTASPTVGQTIVFDGSLWKPANVASSLSSLTDVDVLTASPTVGQVLGWDGLKWVPATGGKTLIAGNGVTIVQDTTTATISSAGKTLVAGNGVTIDQDATTATISSAGKALVAGNGVSIVQDATTATISSAGKALVGSSPIVITQDATTATISFDYTSAIHNNLSGLNGDADYYHLSQAKYNAVQNLTASGTQTNFNGDVQSSSCVYYGSSTVDGSYRDCASGGVLIRSKRVSGSWSEVYRVE